MIQYTRVYRDADGNVLHVHTQSTPIDFDPVQDANVALAHDHAIEHVDDFIMADEMVESIEKSTTGALKINPEKPLASRKGIKVRGLSMQEQAMTINYVNGRKVKAP